MPQTGARPLDEQALVLAADRPLGPVGAHRPESYQGIEVETTQSTGVRADAKIELVEVGPQRERQQDSDERGEEGDRRAPGIDPGDRRGGDDEPQRRPDELPAQLREVAQPMRGVAPLGHVRDRSALEVAVHEAGNLLEERDAQSSLQATTKTHQSARDS